MFTLNDIIFGLIAVSKLITINAQDLSTKSCHSQALANTKNCQLVNHSSSKPQTQISASAHSQFDYDELSMDDVVMD